jgi:hypothetical protein
MIFPTLRAFCLVSLEGLMDKLSCIEPESLQLFILRHFCVQI